MQCTAALYDNVCTTGGIILPADVSVDSLDTSSLIHARAIKGLLIMNTHWLFIGGGCSLKVVHLRFTV